MRPGALLTPVPITPLHTLHTLHTLNHVMACCPEKVRLVFPDVGASALAMRDWAGEDEHVVSSFGRSAPEIDESDDIVIVIAPASSEIEQVRWKWVVVRV